MQNALSLVILVIVAKLGRTKGRPKDGLPGAYGLDSKEVLVEVEEPCQRVREALLACSNADRAYLRRWVLRWVDDHGHIRPDADKLPENGC